MPDQSFRGLFEETAHLDWAPTEGLRRRARQRQRRQRLAVGVAAAAVVAVVAAGAAVAIDRGPGPDPVPPATPTPSVAPSESGSGSPSPAGSAGLGGASGSAPATSSSSKAAPVIVTEVPLAATLAPADAGSSGWTRKDEVNGDWNTGFTFSICPAADKTWPTDSVDDRETEVSGPDGRYVLQNVRAFPTVAAARGYLAWVRGNVRACATFNDLRLSILDEGFAGDESLIVRVTGTNDQIYGFVRVGNLVTEYLPSDDTQARTAQLGPRAAARMCAVTRSC